MLGLNAMALVLVVMLLFVGVLAVRAYTAAKDVSSALPVRQLPNTPTGMLATVDTDGQLTSVTIFVLAPGTAGGGSIVSIPVNADTQTGGDAGAIPLRVAYTEGGTDALIAGVESALRISIDYTKVADPFTAGQLLLPLGPVSVDLPRDVRITADGRVQVGFKRGKQSLSPPQLVEVLTARDEQETDRLRRPAIEAVWTGVADRIGSGIPGLAVVPSIASFDDLVVRLLSGPVAARGLPANDVPAAQNPKGLDVESLDLVETTLVFASIAPSAMTAPAPGPVYRLEAAPGYEQKVREAIAFVLYLGGNVGSVNLGAQVSTETVVYLYNERVKAIADSTNKFFGKVVYATPTYGIQGTDMTIVLGSEYLQSPPQNPTPSTTSPDGSVPAPTTTPGSVPVGSTGGSATTVAP
jgi:hypothetical protein